MPATIGFGEYRPDVSDYNGQHTQVLANVLARGDGYGPVKALQAFAQPLASGNDSFTKVLLHCDGTDASTTITDSNSGGSAHTWTAAGDAQIDTADSKFGGASLLLDGTGDWVSTPDSADFVLGSTFTIDFWFKCNAAGGTAISIAGQADATVTAAGSAFQILRTAANVISAKVSNGSAFTTLTGTTTFTNALHTGWHHCAVVLSGGTLTLWIDGVSEATGSLTGSAPDVAQSLFFGNVNSSGTPWAGWLDELRISVGVARWTAAFTPPQKASDTAANGACRGFTYARKMTDGTIVIFAATATRLFQLNNTTLDWIDVSKSGLAYSQLPTGDDWWFLQYGNNVIVGQANTAPQTFDVTASSAFADLGGSPPNARYGAVVGQFVVLTGLVNNPNRVQWSDQNAITTWTAGTGFASSYDAPDGGIVRGVAGGEYGIIFQESVLRRLIYNPGAKPAFNIERIAEEVGLVGAYSMVRSGERIFFYSAQGFKGIGSSGGTIPIGKERVDRTFAALLDTSNLQFFVGAADPKGTRVFWGFRQPSDSASGFTQIISYDWQLDRWAPPFPTIGEYLGPIVKPGVTLESLDSISSSLDALTFSLDAVGSAIQSSLAAVDVNHQIGFFEGSNLEATLQTPEQSLGSNRVFIRGIRPLTDASSVFGSVVYRDTLQATATTSNEAAMNSFTGICPIWRDTRYARARSRIPAGTAWTYMSGVEPDLDQSGEI